jgi:hypothetical protein
VAYRRHSRRLPVGPKYPPAKTAAAAVVEPRLSQDDAKALARLVGKRGRQALATVANLVPPPRRGRPSASEKASDAGRSYDADSKKLARLVGKYGRGAVLAAIELVPLPQRGPPRRETPLRWEQMHVAAWIYEYAEEFGSIKNALRQLYEMTRDPKRQGRYGDYRSWLSTIKKTRRLGLRYWRQEVPGYIQRGVELPRWLLRRLEPKNK